MCAEGYVQPQREERYLFFSFAWKLFGWLVMSRTLVNYSDVFSH